MPERGQARLYHILCRIVRFYSFYKVMRPVLPRFLQTLFRRHPWRKSIVSLYGAIVRQARTPLFYTDLGVADTVDGRFDMIALHTALVVRRLQDGGGDGPDMAQELFDLLFADMDRNLREMGVGDLSVGKHIRKMAEAYLGRAAAYDAGLAQGADPAALPASLKLNLYRNADPAPTDAQVGTLVDYVRREHARLSALPLADLLSGASPFQPVSVPGAAA